MRTKLFTFVTIALCVIASTSCNKLTTPGVDYENITADMSIAFAKDSLGLYNTFPILEVSFQGANPDNPKGLRMNMEYSVDNNPSQVICYGTEYKWKSDDGTKWLRDNPEAYVKHNSELYVGYRSNYTYYTYFTIPCLKEGEHSVTMTFTTLGHVNADGDSGIGTKYSVTKTFYFTR